MTRITKFTIPLLLSRLKASAISSLFCSDIRLPVAKKANDISVIVPKPPSWISNKITICPRLDQ